MTAVTEVPGIDVSKWQGKFDWKAQAGKIGFAATKATEGLDETDTEFGANWNGMWELDRMMPRWAYHFFHAAIDPYLFGTPHARAALRSVGPLHDPAARPLKRFRELVDRALVRAVDGEHVTRRTGVPGAVHRHCGGERLRVFVEDADLRCTEERPGIGTVDAQRIYGVAEIADVLPVDAPAIGRFAGQWNSTQIASRLARPAEESTQWTWTLRCKPDRTHRPGKPATPNP